MRDALPRALRACSARVLCSRANRCGPKAADPLDHTARSDHTRSRSPLDHTARSDPTLAPRPAAAAGVGVTLVGRRPLPSAFPRGTADLVRAGDVAELYEDGWCATPPMPTGSDPASSPSPRAPRPHALCPHAPLALTLSARPRPGGRCRSRRCSSDRKDAMRRPPRAASERRRLSPSPPRRAPAGAADGQRSGAAAKPAEGSAAEEGEEAAGGGGGRGRGEEDDDDDDEEEEHQGPARFKASRSTIAESSHLHPTRTSPAPSPAPSPASSPASSPAPRSSRSTTTGHTVSARTLDPVAVGSALQGVPHPAHVWPTVG